METGMTERKPREITFASWVDQQIAEVVVRSYTLMWSDLKGLGGRARR